MNLLEGGMVTKLALNNDVVDEAMKPGGHKTKREVANAGLAEYIARRQRRKILDLFGTLDWESRYDSKADRRKR